MPSVAPVSMAGITGMSGPELVGAGGDGGHHLGIDGGVGRGDGLVHFGDGDFGIGQDLFEGALDVGGLFDGQQAAVDDGAGELRERVLGVASGEHGGDAGGAHLGVVKGNGGEAREGGGIVGILHHGLEVGAELSAVDVGTALEGGARDIEEVDGKIELAEAREAVGEVIDGVVAGGHASCVRRCWRLPA